MTVYVNRIPAKSHLVEGICVSFGTRTTKTNTVIRIVLPIPKTVCSTPKPEGEIPGTAAHDTILTNRRIDPWRIKNGRNGVIVLRIGERISFDKCVVYPFPHITAHI